MKKIDTFMFNNELSVLGVRLEALYKHVDLFILVESGISHLGRAKKLHYWENRDLFSKYADKIVYKNAKLTEAPGWPMENQQRYIISKYLKELDLEDGDLILNSDCDEIPRWQLFREAASHPYCFFNQMYFIYHSDLFTNKCVTGTAAVRYGVLKQLDDSYQGRGLQALRNSKDNHAILEDGGHHYSYFGSVQTISDKSRSIAEGSLTSAKNAPEEIEKQRQEALTTLKSPYSPRRLRKMNLEDSEAIISYTTARNGSWHDAEGIWTIKPDVSMETLLKLAAP